MVWVIYVFLLAIGAVIMLAPAILAYFGASEYTFFGALVIGGFAFYASAAALIAPVPSIITVALVLIGALIFYLAEWWATPRLASWLYDRLNN